MHNKFTIENLQFNMKEFKHYYKEAEDDDLLAGVNIADQAINARIFFGNTDPGEGIGLSWNVYNINELYQEIQGFDGYINGEFLLEELTFDDLVKMILEGDVIEIHYIGEVGHVDGIICADKEKLKQYALQSISLNWLNSLK